MKYILASGSPRRKELLHQMGITNFTILVSHEEEVITKTSPKEIVEELALQKGKNVIDTCILNHSDYESENCLIVISADTIVADQNRILGKPSNIEDAFTTLCSLRGHAHSVFTGVAISKIEQGKIINTISFVAETKVFMRNTSDAELHDYIATKEPMDKAGSYGIQGLGAILVDHIEGDYNNVVGLPISSLYQHLKQL